MCLFASLGPLPFTTLAMAQVNAPEARLAPGQGLALTLTMLTILPTPLKPESGKPTLTPVPDKGAGKRRCATEAGLNRSILNAAQNIPASGVGATARGEAFSRSDLCDP